MPEPICRIISASAGTGKTYRLSLEYLAILIQYYGVEDFRIDNILALTFTRKATAEIRARIILHMELLLSSAPDESKDRGNLISNLRMLVPGEKDELSVMEQNRILSAYREIGCDSSKLQVMTIDAYIGNIFRNIVRPMRNIESYDIDIQAVDKRMPYLMDHLMQAEFRQRLDKLLSRKLSRSLDEYSKFFKSLVDGRWLYYMIMRRLDPQALPGECRVVDIQPCADPHPELECFHAEMQNLLAMLSDISNARGKGSPEELLNVEFKRLCNAETASWSEIADSVQRAGKALNHAEAMLNVLSAKNIWNGSIIRGNKYQETIAKLWDAQEKAKRSLANYLMEKLYLPEQKEIMELWGVVLKEYDRLIYHYKNMTYNDISWFSFEALFSDEPQIFDPQSEASATEFYQFLSHRTRFLLIDEFQDTSLIQFNILYPIIAELTSGEGSKPFQGLIVVGDEKQSIFGWRGGERDLLLNLPMIFGPLRNVSLERLDQSWRCPPTLMSFINRIFQSEGIHDFLKLHQLRWEYEPIHSKKPELEKELELSFCLQNYSRTDAAGLASGEAYADFVHRMVVPALKEDPSGSIAILCRKSSDLERIQEELDALDISNLYQPDRNIGEHPLVSPLLAWLRYVAWGDWCDLLVFLRSDYIKMSSTLLKQAVDAIAAFEAKKKVSKAIRCDFSSLPGIGYFVDLAAKHRTLHPSFICQRLVDLCLSGMQASPRDLLNLHHFIHLLGDWELNIAQDALSIPEMLAYLSENNQAEDMKQRSVSFDEGLQLLTIHKSKGLEFKRVFMFYNLSARHRNEGRTLSWAIDFRGHDFHLLKDFGISLHYEKVLKASQYSTLWEASEQRAILEEMNTLYVALTRAKSKLHIYFCYENKEPWPKYLGSNKNPSLPLLLCDACNSYFQEKGTPQEDSSDLADNGESGFSAGERQAVYLYRGDWFEPPQASPELASEMMETKQTVPLWQLPEAYPYPPHPDFSQMAMQTDNVEMNWKQVWLHDKHNIYGELLHFHLSFIIHNHPDEHDYAYRRCLGQYGSLLPVSMLSSALAVCRRFCNENPWLFEAKWDYIRNELELKTPSGNIRIDRLMISGSAKEVLIVDYKSGGIHDPLQLEKYQKDVAAMLKLADYRISTRFCKI